MIAFGIYQWQMRPPPGTLDRTFAHGGLERHYLVHPGPAEVKQGLLLVLHGSGGRGRMIERRTGLDPIAEKAGMVTVYPDGIDAVWNDGWRPDSSVDDVGFLTALASALAAEFRIDPARVFAAGFSNGAGMAHRLACESDRFAAIAPVGGYPPRNVLERCLNSNPVSVIDLHGTDDQSVSYEPLTRVLGYWLTRNGCAQPGTSRELPDVDPDDGTRVRIDEHSHCREGARVVLYSIEGGGHRWPGEHPDPWRRGGRVSHDIDASALIIDFFLK